MRADARRNRARVVEAARAAFAEHGPQVPLDVIAQRAGVGAGTVYRHFSSKEALFAAVQEECVHELVARGEALRAGEGPDVAFFAFLDLLADRGEVKRDLPEAIAIPTALGEQVRAVLAALLSGAQEAGAVRPGLTADDLVALLKALAHVAAAMDGDRVRRLREVVVAGLRP